MQPVHCLTTQSEFYAEFEMHTHHIRLRALLDLRYVSGTNSPAYDALGSLLNIYDHKMGSPQTQGFPMIT